MPVNLKRVKKELQTDISKVGKTPDGDYKFTPPNIVGRRVNKYPELKVTKVKIEPDLKNEKLKTTGLVASEEKTSMRYKVTIHFFDVPFREIETAQFNNLIKTGRGRGVKSYYHRNIAYGKNDVVMRCNCFTGDTKVVMGDGNQKEIKDLVSLPSFNVLSFNEETKKTVISKGVKCESKGVADIYEIHLDNNEIIRCTGEHKFLTKSGEWVEAQYLTEDLSLEPLYMQDNKVRNNFKWEIPQKLDLKDKHYNYIYLDPRKPGNYVYGDMSFSFEPFYIGKGKNRRALAISGRYNEIFTRKLKKIKDAGLEPIVLVSDFVTNLVACEREKHLISLIGRLNKHEGPLANQTDGGEGLYGLTETERNKSLNTRKNNGVFKEVSKRMKKNNPMKRKEVVNKVIETKKLKGIPVGNADYFNQDDPEVRNKMSLAKKGKISKNFKKCQEKSKELLAKGNHNFQTEEHKEWAKKHYEAGCGEKMAANNSKLIKNKKLKDWIHGLPDGVYTINTQNFGYRTIHDFRGAIKRLANKTDGITYDSKTKELIKTDKYYNHRVKKVIKTNEKEEVFCFTVLGTGNFFVGFSDGSGTCVSNCKDFRHRFSAPLRDAGGLYGGFIGYTRKTDPWPIGRPFANSTEKLGICKHISSFLKHLEGEGILKNR